MSAPAFATELDLAPLLPSALDDRGLPGRLELVLEMLDSLATLSAAGQRYTMSKVVVLLHEQAKRVSQGLGERNRHTLAELVAKLSDEAERPWPDAEAFSDRALGLTGLLLAFLG